MVMRDALLHHALRVTSICISIMSQHPEASMLLLHLNTLTESGRRGVAKRMATHCCLGQLCVSAEHPGDAKVPQLDDVACVTSTSWCQHTAA